MSDKQSQMLKESILVVDDTPSNVQLLSKMLSVQGYSVQVALSGRAALKLVQAAQPDLVVLDLMMPEMNGWEVCQQLKADDRTRQIPVIFISASDAAQDKVEALAIGGADYITRPFHAKEVIVRIENQLNVQRLQKQLIAQNERLQQEIREREKAENALAQQLDRTLLLQQITEAIRSHLSSQRIFATAATQVGRAFGVNRCNILTYVPDPAPQHLVVVAEYVEVGYLPLEQEEIHIAGNPHAVRLLSQDRAIASPNVYLDSLLQSVDSIYQRAGLKSMLAVRTSYQGQTNGAIALHQCDRFREWTTGEIELLEAIASQVGIALAQAKLLEQEQRQRKVLDCQILLLRQEIQERRQAEAALRASEAELQGLFAAMTDQVVVRDASGRCLKIAPTCPTSYRPAEELLGKTLHETLPIVVADRLLGGIQNSLTTRRTVNLEYCLSIRGEEVWLSTHISPLSRNTVILVSRDISVAKHSEADRQHQQEALRLIVEGTAAKTGSEFFRSLVRHLAEVLRVRCAYVTEFADSRKNHVGTLAFWQGSDFGSNFEYLLVATPCAQVLAGEVCYYPNLMQTLFPQDQKLAELNVESYLGIPLTNSIGQVLGHLAVLDDKPMQNNPTRQLIVNIFAARAGAELERKQVEDALRQSAQREHTILTVVERMRQTLDVEQIFRVVTQELRQLLNCDRVAIYRFNPDWSGGFVAESVGDGWVSLIQEHIQDANLTQEAFESDRCLVKTWNSLDPIADTHLQETQGGAYRQDVPYLSVKDIDQAGFAPCYLNLLKRFQARAYLTVPIFLGSRLWGLLACYQNSAPRDWKDAEISLVVHISRQFGVALQQADLLAETQQKSAELKQARDAAETASRAKSEFLSSMSHELRTPLNAILGFTQLISRDATLSSEHRSHLNIINRSGQHLLDLINDVLEMSKIEAGRARLNEASFDLYYLLCGLEEMLRLKAIAKQLAFRVERSPQVPQHIITDEGKLRQVLLNLLGNAIKFTRSGHVTLRVLCSSQPSTEEGVDCQLTFEVEDTGLGIDAAEIEQLFKPFVQTQAGRQSQEGTGLGLAISRKYIRLMGGDITVKSVPNQGSIFTFDIWVCRSQTSRGRLPSSLAAQQVTALASGQPPYRLLVAEDQPENQQLLLQLLTAVGFEVALAQNGQQAIDLWRQWQPHLILMDMQMPVLNGYKATQQIKAAAKTQKIVIIAVTGSAFEEDRAAILAVGCDDFIGKPFQQQEIFAKLAEHLGVEYCYEEVDEQVDRSTAVIQTEQVTAATLAVMPETWITQLRLAASGCSDRRVLHLIEQIPAGHTVLIRSLTELVYHFRFEDIIELTRSAML